MLSAQGGAQLCLGSVTEGWPEGLHPGEILLRSAGGASIKLCSDGKILLNGKEWKEAWRSWTFCCIMGTMSATRRDFCSEPTVRGRASSRR